MSQRKIGKSPALGAPYGGTVTGRLSGSEPPMQFIKPPMTDDAQRMVDEIKRAARAATGVDFVGTDFAKGPDQSAIVLATNKGTHVVFLGGENPTVDRAWLNGLDANRKGDREALALVLLSLAGNRGAIVERRDTPATPGFGGAGIDLTFKLNGVGASCSIDNLHGGAYALISWFNDYSGGRRGALDFTARFALLVGDGPTIRGGRLHHKATSCGADWYSLAMFLDGGLMLAARGEAFNPSAS